MPKTARRQTGLTFPNSEWEGSGHFGMWKEAVGQTHHREDASGSTCANDPPLPGGQGVGARYRGSL